ncbi:MAG: hypothetical protein A4E57_03959 [Syntrophorhabdaceae bacterium PtaU1.Bin034]|nr:MAG: hypothetical protein A4E57_03959 [Syntrophorhabdaceae bacterium PtaU1.Bin034]
MYCTHVSLLERKVRTRDGGRYSMRTPMIKATATKIRMSSAVMIVKNFAAVTRLLMANMLNTSC